jgi:hypothetical protein
MIVLLSLIPNIRLGRKWASGYHSATNPLAQAWVRLKFSASLPCSIEQNREKKFCFGQISFRSSLIFSGQAEIGWVEFTGMRQVKFPTILIWEFSFKVRSPKVLILYHWTEINPVYTSFTQNTWMNFQISLLWSPL